MRLGFIPSCSREKVVGKKHGCWFTHYVLETEYCNNHSVQSRLLYLAASFWFPGKSQDDLQLSHPFTLFIEARRTFWETNVIKLIVIYSQLNWKKISCLAAFAAK